MDSELSTRGLHHHPRGSNREILIGGSGLPAGDVDRDSAGTPFDGEAVGKTDPAEEGLEAVEAVRLPGEYPEEEVELGRGVEGEGVTHAARTPASLSPKPVRATDQSPSAVIGMNVVK